jgi:hypothetical protein
VFEGEADWDEGGGGGEVKDDERNERKK